MYLYCKSLNLKAKTLKILQIQKKKSSQNFFVFFFAWRKTRKLVAHLIRKQAKCFLFLFFTSLCLNEILHSCIWLYLSLVSIVNLTSMKKKLLSKLENERKLIELLRQFFSKILWWRLLCLGAHRASGKAHCHSLTNLAKTSVFYEQKLSRKAWTGTLLTCP